MNGRDTHVLTGALFRPAHKVDWMFGGDLDAGRVGDGIGRIGGVAVILFSEGKDFPGDVRFAREGERWQSKDKGPCFVLRNGEWEYIPPAA
jgi:hypothetical protein